MSLMKKAATYLLILSLLLMPVVCLATAEEAPQPVIETRVFKDMDIPPSCSPPRICTMAYGIPPSLKQARAPCLRSSVGSRCPELPAM